MRNDYYQSAAGNVYGFLKGKLEGEPLLFSAHLDTVEPSKGKEALLLEDGKIVSKGDTSLGADDISGLVEILRSYSWNIRRWCRASRYRSVISLLQKKLF
jgi:tripeptide aminopeptidase